MENIENEVGINHSLTKILRKIIRIDILSLNDKVVMQKNR